MAKTYLDQLVDYPAKIMQYISEDKNCVGLLVNKGFDEVTEDDYEKTLDKYIYDYQYVDETAEEASAYIWVEIEVNKVENKRIKDITLYVSVVCHKDYMRLNGRVHKGLLGNRRDNIARYIDKLLNGKGFVGIGNFKLVSVRTLKPAAMYSGRQLAYTISDFNIVPIEE